MSPTRFHYDPAGNITGVTDPLGRSVSFEYDLVDRPIRITEPNPGGGAATPVTFLAYDGLGRLIRERDPRGTLTRYEYDQRHRLTRVSTILADRQEPIANSFQYDDRGLVTKLIDPLGRETTYTYDEAGRLTELLLPDPNDGSDNVPVTYEYDTLSNLRFVTDQLDHTTEYQYDERYRLAKEIDANPEMENQGTTIYRYNLAGDLTELEDAVGNETTWEYDDLGRVVTETNELSDDRLYEYDEFHRLVEMTDRNGRVTEYDYDNLHRLIEERWLDGMSTVNTISYTWDEASQLDEISDSYATYDYTYDNLGRATQVEQTITGLTPTVTFDREYDPLGLMTQTTATIGATEDFVNNYVHDALGRMTQVTQAEGTGNAVAEKRVDLVYDAASQLTSIDRYADVAGTSPVVARVCAEIDLAVYLQWFDLRKTP